MEFIEKINKSKSIWEIIPSLTIEDIEFILTKSSDNYYNTGEELIFDKNFDILLDLLKEKNPKSKFLQSIGAPIKGKKVLLPFWMGSMDKIKYDEVSLCKWLKKNKGPYLISDKLDGISTLLVKSSRGELKLYTRGNGE